MWRRRTTRRLKSGHRSLHRTCPLLGVKRTCRLAPQMSANDPKRTSDVAYRCAPICYALVSRRPWTFEGDGRMYRRDFIKVIAGSAAAWPIASHAQQTTRMPRIGVLLPGTPASFALRHQGVARRASLGSPSMSANRRLTEPRRIRPPSPASRVRPTKESFRGRSPPTRALLAHARRQRWNPCRGETRQTRRRGRGRGTRWPLRG